MKRLNLREGRKGQKGGISPYDISFRRKVALHYLEGNQSVLEVALEYGVKKQSVQNWSRIFSKELAEKESIVITDMTDQESKDLEQLKKQNEALKKSLEYERIKNFALETMIDLAKEELGIDLRKNSGAKQPKE
jgi:transposase